MRRLIATLLLATTPVAAQARTAPVLLSAAPDGVSVTLYRDPDRGADPIDRDNPSSFALISETRTITLPPGVVTVRFEGVASGIVPQSAILFGTDPRERNRDAALLSQAGLVDAYTGQQVILRRTDPASGKMVEERATIRSAANRMIIDTPRGVEAVYCTGLAQTLLYPGAPATLSARPVLTMTTKDQPGGTVTITLAYVATGFDWDATYVGTLSEDDAKLDLFAWLTMASADDTSFVDATTSAVAGRVNRSDETRDDGARQALAAARRLDRTSQCWPAGTTSDVRTPPSASPPPPYAPMMMEMRGEDIIVTARSRAEEVESGHIAVTAHSESLSDLKLYRIPVPVTVAARSQKQVAFLANRRLSGSLIYRSRASCCEPAVPELLYRFRNEKRAGLGEPLPAGNVVLYQRDSRGRQLAGEGRIADKAVGQEVEIMFGDAQGVSLEHDEERTEDGLRHRLTVRNANPFPVRYELEFINDPDISIYDFPEKLVTRPGKRVWATILHPNSEVRLSYRSRTL